MGEVRHTAEAAEIIRKVSQSTDPMVALRLLSTLAGKKIYETQIKEGFGVATSTRWVPIGSWDGENNSDSWNGKTDWFFGSVEQIYQDVMDLIPQNQVLLIESEERLVVVTKTTRLESRDERAYLQFRVAKKI